MASTTDRKQAAPAGAARARPRPPRKSRFRNEPAADFGVAEARQSMETALSRLARARPERRGLRIGGETVMTGERLASTDPACPGTVLGEAALAGPAEVDLAVAKAAEAFETWKRVPFTERAELLFRAARLLRRRRFEFDALLVREAGKVWREADADTAEAIDFLEFYGREMLRYGVEQTLEPIAGEDNRLEYLPLGVVAVIPPWNFPLAILVGMTAASAVAGNTVVLKPSSETPLVAARAVDLFEKAGAPPGVINFLPGSGASIGDRLVTHDGVRAVAFTGSMEVGLRIHERAARAGERPRWLKRVIAEMGGKNAIIVDESADLDLAAEGVVASAFGYQGQKCSACSRLIALAPIHDALLERVVARARALRVDAPARFEAEVGPVISASARDRILRAIEAGKREARLRCGGGPARVPGFEEGYFVEPTVFAGVPPASSLAQEEIFGPVLAVLSARDFDEALAIANGTRFGLTGAVYSRRRERLDRARAEFDAGNLYFNRKCTGALVGAHPFGGFKLSGTDSKAGGRDYLLLFLQAKVVSERLGAASAAPESGR
jgi:1-pyrroline-5-carboxylate dehydrogenase